MLKHELLVPAGNMECLYQAVYNGADAVYLSGKSFGARKFAPNFTNEEIVSAIEFCHLYGVRVYVTMNTLIHNDEVSSFLEQARFLHKNGVDALIVQDFGMICLLREMFPNLEIHASTQANNSSVDTCRLFHQLGVKRVVLSRELSIDEINSIDVPIEKEVFIHGALCVSYSGCCLMSSMIGGRSGNRGECAGCCRLPYSLYHGSKCIKNSSYLLSTKELNTTSYIKELLNSNITSFKIEGRMKGPLYVGFITHLYRRLIDGDVFSLEEELDRLKTIFNREFTKGRLFYATDQDFINPSFSNHIGLKIGRAEVVNGKIKIILDPGRVLCQNDSIRFLNSKKGFTVNYLYDERDLLCRQSDNVCYVDNHVDLTGSDVVMKTQDSSLDPLYIRHEAIRKVPISYFVYAKVGEPLRIEVSDDSHKALVLGDVVELANSSPTSCDDISEKLSKIHDTPFEIKKINFQMDSNVFIPLKTFNHFRRELLNQLMEFRKKSKVEFVEVTPNFSKNDLQDDNISSSITCTVYSEEQLSTCLSLNFARIYVHDYNLYQKYKSYENVICVLERCSYDYSQCEDKNYVSDVFEYHSHDFYGGYELNVTNIYSAYYLKKIGLKTIPFSCEINKEEMDSFIKSYNQKFGFSSFEVLAYGRVENMIIKGNILNLTQDDKTYYLLDVKSRKFPVYYDGVKTHIFHDKPNTCSLLNHSNVYYHFCFYDESSNQIENVVNSFFSLK